METPASTIMMSKSKLSARQNTHTHTQTQKTPLSCVCAGFHRFNHVENAHSITRVSCQNICISTSLQYSDNMDMILNARARILLYAIDVYYIYRIAVAVADARHLCGVLLMLLLQQNDCG